VKRRKTKSVARRVDILALVYEKGGGMRQLGQRK
jgi:hypothetical protein